MGDLFLKEITANFLISSVLTLIVAFPIINFLYRLNITDFKKLSQDLKNKVFYQLHKHKAGTPSSGGLMILVSLIFYFVFISPELTTRSGLLIIAITLASFVGLADDIIKLLVRKKLLGSEIKIRYQILIQVFMGGLISYLLYSWVGITSVTLLGTEINFDVFSFTILGSLYFSSLVTAFNITDGLDGLFPGMAMISLLPIVIISSIAGDYFVASFGTYLMGAILTFLYFNVNPARVFLGDVGSSSIAFILALLTIYVDAIIPMTIVFLIFYLEFISSFSQIIALRMGRRLFKIAPLHHTFEAIGWSETKVVFRFWLGQIFLSVLGLFLYFSFSV